MKELLILMLSIFFVQALPGYDMHNPKIISESADNGNWKTCHTFEDVVKQYPHRVHFLFNRLDLSRPELSRVKAALDRRDTVKACAVLVNYFKTNPAGNNYRQTDGDYSSEVVDKAMDDILLASGDWFKIPRIKDGGLNWSYEGPPDYTNNQMHQINRFVWMDDLLFAGMDGRDACLVKLDEYLRDWCIHADEHRRFDPSARGSELDAGIRMKRKALPVTFYSFLSAPQFQDATKILMLEAIARHGPYLRHHHSNYGNTKTTMLLGLLIFSDAFPEFKKTEEYIAYANNVVVEELRNSFYVEEGVQKELAQGYHKIVVEDLEQYRELFERNGVSMDDLLNPLILKGWEYVALSSKPNGHGLMLNDAGDGSFKKNVVQRAKIYNRPEWLYIFSNGAQGVRPAKGPSVMYAWSGRMISRDGWDADTRWSVFDAGPHGIGHQHNDKLHISIFAHGRDLLTDAGKFTYRGIHDRSPRDWRGYFKRSWSHNVILVNHKSQNDEINLATEPLTDWKITDLYDFALGTFDKGWDEHEGKHQRAFFNIKDKCWLICDRMELQESSSIQALWHFRPECTVIQTPDDHVLTTDAGKGNIRIIPVTADRPGWEGNNEDTITEKIFTVDLDRPQWEVEVLKGQVDPYYQGWYSAKTNRKEPSPCAVYEAADVKTAQFAWLITTDKGEPPVYKAEIVYSEGENLKVRIDDNQGSKYMVDIDFGKKQGHVSVKDQ